MRILLAEDQHEVRSLVAEVLKDQGHQVLVVEDGQQALAESESQSVDLLITDFDMPGLDGVELCRRLRRRHPNLPAVLLSSRCGEAGWRPDEPMVCLAKPFRRQQLLDALTQALRIPPGGVPSQGTEPETSRHSTDIHRTVPWGLAAALLLVVGWVFTPPLLDRFGGPPALPEPVRQGPQRDATLQLLAPVGVLAQLPEAAAWQTLPDASLYQLRFETVDGITLLETRAEASPWPIPEELRRQLPANVAFHWRVDALSSSGQLLARSPQTRFRVVAPIDVGESTSSKTTPSNPSRTP